MVRDEMLPRVSSYISFIGADEFAGIPEAALEVASAHGTKNHAIIENGYGKPSNNLIVDMFTAGLKLIFTPKELGCMPIFEGQLNGKRFTGKPDFRLGTTLTDYKFSNDLRPQTALQLVLYGMLIYEIYGVKMNRFYAFHFPTDHGLFIYKVSDRALKPLHEFAEYIVENHSKIDGGGLERYDALSRWDKLLEDYEMFEPAGTVLPPMTITCEEQAKDAVTLYHNMKKVTDYETLLKREIKRYMEGENIKRMEDINGCGVRLQSKKTALHDSSKKKFAKGAYNQALAKCQTGTFETVSVVRFSPRPKKPKQIN